MFPYLKVLLLTGLLAVILDNCLALSCASGRGRCLFLLIPCHTFKSKCECSSGEKCCHTGGNHRI